MISVTELLLFFINASKFRFLHFKFPYHRSHEFFSRSTSSSDCKHNVTNFFHGHSFQQETQRQVETAACNAVAIKEKYK